MKIGDLVKFKGTWSDSVSPRKYTGIVMEVWINGRSRKQQGVDILWDTGDVSKQFGVHHLEVINESR